MILLLQNDVTYDYDIRNLLQAFFDNEKVVTTPEGTRMSMEVTFREQGTHSVAFCSPEGKWYSREFVGDYKDKMACRNTVKHAVYEVLSEYQNRQLPWGTLTGVRPVKIISGMLEKGYSPEEAKKEFQKTYLTSPQKAEISTRVALKEREILASLDYENQYSLYIGIPFCPSTCLYCSFTSYPIAVYQEMVEAYLKALEKEMAFTAQAMKGKHLISVYIGGGTPTSLSARQLDWLIKQITSHFSLEHMKEFTVEAGRPDSITEDKLQVLYHSPVTRISINPQTMQDKTLKLIGRAHTVEQTVRTYEMARNIGFDNINMDMIVGLPGEDIIDVKDSLHKIAKLKPDNLTVHSLALKRAANLTQKRQEYESLIKGSTNEMLEEADAVAASIGLEPYYLYRQKNIPGNLENVGYAACQKEGLYNILIMEEKQTIMALGAGASTKYVYAKEDRIERTENVKDVKLYISRIDEMIQRKEKML